MIIGDGILKEGYQQVIRMLKIDKKVTMITIITVAIVPAYGARKSIFCIVGFKWPLNFSPEYTPVKMEISVINICRSFCMIIRLCH